MESKNLYCRVRKTKETRSSLIGDDLIRKINFLFPPLGRQPSQYHIGLVKSIFQDQIALVIVPNNFANVVTFRRKLTLLLHFGTLKEGERILDKKSLTDFSIDFFEIFSYFTSQSLCQQLWLDIKIQRKEDLQRNV